MAANRGEIATRIMRAGTELGCGTVGIYSHEGTLYVIYIILFVCSVVLLLDWMMFVDDVDDVATEINIHFLTNMMRAHLPTKKNKIDSPNIDTRQIKHLN